MNAKPMAKWYHGLFAIASIFLLGGCASISAANAVSWKEEALLHDGSKLIVERSQTDNPSGYREVGQPAPRAEEAIRFTHPGTNKIITWKSDFGRDQQDNLSLLVLDIVDNTPYIATHPGFCHAFNKWGRPNPPYVFFKFDGKAWQRIPLAEFPAEIKEANVTIGGYNVRQRPIPEGTIPYLTPENIQKQNSHMSPETRYLRVIAREEIKSAALSCSIYEKGWK